MQDYKLNIRDMSAKTNHLEPLESGILIKLINHYYETEHPIPTLTQSVIRQLRLGSYESQFKAILAEFFTLKNDGWHNNRCDTEISRYQKRAKTARENGKLSHGRPKNNPAITQSVIKNNPDVTHRVTKITHNKPTGLPESVNKCTKAGQNKPTGLLKSVKEGGEGGVIKHNDSVINSNIINNITTKKKITKEKSKSDEIVEKVFDRWVSLMSKNVKKFTAASMASRKSKIKSRIKDGYTEDQMILAIEGCARSPHHMGQNDTGTVYDDLTLILRSGEKLEGFIARNTTTSFDSGPLDGESPHAKRTKHNQKSLIQQAYDDAGDGFDFDECETYQTCNGIMGADDSVISLQVGGC